MVSGYYGFGNAGDELILSVICEALAGHEVTVLSADPEGTAREFGVAAVRRFDLAGIWRALGRADLLVSGGGGLLQDATGPGSVPYYLGVIGMARTRGLRVMIYAQGVGPIRKRWARAALALLRGVAAATVRDPESRELLQRAGVRVIEVTADAALALPVPPRAGVPPELRALGLDGASGVIGLAPRPYGGAGFVDRLAQAVGQVAARTGARVLLVPMQRQEDTGACLELHERLGPVAVLLPADVAPRRFPAIFAACRTVVGMRLHALILAALGRVPSVGLGYDPKIRAFAQSLQPDVSDLPLDSSLDRMAAAIAERLQADSERDARLDQAVGELQRLAARNNEVLRALLAPARDARAVRELP